MNKKKHKNFYNLVMGLALTPPTAQHSQKFLRRFFKKRLLALAKKNPPQQIATEASNRINRIGGDGFEPPTLSV